MRRRDILASVGSLAAGTSVSLPAPAIAQGIRQLKMVTDWPAGSPGMQSSAVRLARRIGVASGGRMKIEVFPAGALVRPFETFDAVGTGVADMYHSADYYWGSKSPAFSFFAGVPFGFTADELYAWVEYGGGQELWDALSGQFNIKPFLALNTGTQGGGWSTREIGSLEALKGLRYRMPGLGGEVLRRAGAIVVTVPGIDIITSLKSGALDASEWVGPWTDMAMGLHQVTSYYYYPGFHEPGSASTLGINRALWDRLDASDQRLIEDATTAEYVRALSEFNANNALWLGKLQEQGNVKIVKFDDSLLKAFLAISKEVVAEAGSGDDLSKKIYASYQQFRTSTMNWSDTAERAFLNSRSLA